MVSVDPLNNVVMPPVYSGTWRMTGFISKIVPGAFVKLAYKLLGTDGRHQIIE